MSKEKIKYECHNCEHECELLVYPSELSSITRESGCPAGMDSKWRLIYTVQPPTSEALPFSPDKCPKGHDNIQRAVRERPHWYCLICSTNYYEEDWYEKDYLSGTQGGEPKTKLP